MQVGQSVRLTVEGDATEHVGRVARLSPAIQEQNRTLAIEAEIPNDNGLLRPGSFARAAIVTQVGAAGRDGPGDRDRDVRRHREGDDA